MLLLQILVCSTVLTGLSDSSALRQVWAPVCWPIWASLTAMLFFQFTSLFKPAPSACAVYRSGLSQPGLLMIMYTLFAFTVLSDLPVLLWCVGLHMLCQWKKNWAFFFFSLVLQEQWEWNKERTPLCVNFYCNSVQQMLDWSTSVTWGSVGLIGCWISFVERGTTLVSVLACVCQNGKRKCECMW